MDTSQAAKPVDASGGRAEVVRRKPVAVRRGVGGRGVEHARGGAVQDTQPAAADGKAGKPFQQRPGGGECAVGTTENDDQRCAAAPPQRPFGERRAALRQQDIGRQQFAAPAIQADARCKLKPLPIVNRAAAQGQHRAGRAQRVALAIRQHQLGARAAVPCQPQASQLGAGEQAAAGMPRDLAGNGGAHIAEKAADQGQRRKRLTISFQSLRDRIAAQAEQWRVRGAAVKTFQKRSAQRIRIQRVVSDRAAQAVATLYNRHTPVKPIT